MSAALVTEIQQALVTELSIQSRLGVDLEQSSKFGYRHSSADRKILVQSHKTFSVAVFFLVSLLLALNSYLRTTQWKYNLNRTHA